MSVTIQDNFSTAAAKPTDARYGPYNSDAAAALAIPETFRYKGLTVGVLNSGVVEEYWWDNVLTGNPIKKSSSGNVTSISQGTGILVNTTSPNSPQAPSISIGPTVQVTGNLSTNVSTDGGSDTKYPSVKAVKTYADGLVVGLLNDRGNWAASATSPGAYPTVPPATGSGPAGAILKGDIWFINTAGYLGTTYVSIGASVRALVNSPGQTAANWDIIDAGLGFTPENTANKVTSGAGITGDPSSTIKYPSLKALTEYLAGQTPTTPSLQAVTNVGASTTTSISAESFKFKESTTSNYAELLCTSTGVVTVKDSLGNKRLSLNKAGTDLTVWTTSGTVNSILNFASVTSTQTFTFPNATGTVALQEWVNSQYVPYTGATSDINIGTKRITGTIFPKSFQIDANGIIIGNSPYTNDISNNRIFINESSGSNKYVDIGLSLGYPAVIVSDSGNGGGGVLTYNDGDAYLYLSDVGGTKVQIGTTGDSYINTTGKFGIGTDDPDTKLHIKDNFPSLKVEATNGLTVTGSLSTNPFGFGYGTFELTSSGHLKLISGSGGTGSQYVIDATSGNHWFGTGFSSFPSTNNKFWFKGGSMYVEDRISCSTLGVGFNSSVNASAALEIQSTTTGFLPPRMTTVQRNAISSPATGLLVYDTTDNVISLRDNSSWKTMISGSGTQNYLARWSGPNTLGSSSVIFDDGTRVGIKTATPNASYDVTINGTTLCTNDVTIDAAKSLYFYKLKLTGNTAFNLDYIQLVSQSTNLGASIYMEANGTPTQYGYVWQSRSNAAENGFIIVGCNANPSGPAKDQNAHIISTYANSGTAQGWPLKFRVAQAGQNWSGGSGAEDLMVLTPSQNVGIGTSSPNASAKLQIDSTTSGFLPPRMTGAQANAISSKAEGLMVYVTDNTGGFATKGWWGWDGSTWQKLG